MKLFKANTEKVKKEEEKAKVAVKAVAKKVAKVEKKEAKKSPTKKVTTKKELISNVVQSLGDNAETADQKIARLEKELAELKKNKVEPVVAPVQTARRKEY